MFDDLDNLSETDMKLALMAAQDYVGARENFSDATVGPELGTCDLCGDVQVAVVTRTSVLDANWLCIPCVVATAHSAGFAQGVEMSANALRELTQEAMGN
jgi:hypothetical protein